MLIWCQPSSTLCTQLNVFFLDILASLFNPSLVEKNLWLDMWKPGKSAQITHVQKNGTFLSLYMINTFCKLHLLSYWYINAGLNHQQHNYHECFASYGELNFKIKPNFVYRYALFLQAKSHSMISIKVGNWYLTLDWWYLGC